MIPFSRRYETLVNLGKYLSTISLNRQGSERDETERLVRKLHVQNPWFVEPFVLKALEQWSVRLSPASLREYISKYPNLNLVRTERHVTVIPDNHVPFAGMADLVAVLLAGDHFYGKNQDHQQDDLNYITNKLTALEPAFTEYIHWNSPSKEVDTYLVHSKPGNERAFASYFGERHSLMRQKRISVSIVSDSDGAGDFRRLGDDIFTFFGLSPYNVRKLFVPRTFSLDQFFGAMEQYAWIYQHNRYANNYDYHKSVFLMDRIPFYDNGFLVLRQSGELHVPPGCLYYEYYDDTNDLSEKLACMAPVIQQIVTRLTGFLNAVKPGEAHAYQLWDFEDHKDSLQFLLHELD